MALINLGSGIMFKVFPKKLHHKQQIKLRPLELFTKDKDGYTHIEYTCQICEQIGLNYNSLLVDDYTFYGKEFKKFTFPKGTKKCPCCGINIDWRYRDEKIK